MFFAELDRFQPRGSRPLWSLPNEQQELATTGPQRHPAAPTQGHESAARRQITWPGRLAAPAIGPRMAEMLFAPSCRLCPPPTPPVDSHINI